LHGTADAATGELKAACVPVELFTTAETADHTPV